MLSTWWTTLRFPLVLLSLVLAVAVGLGQAGNSPSLPYQSPDPEHLQHMAENDMWPASARVANRDHHRTVDQLPSTYIPQSWLPATHGLGTVSAVAFDHTDNVIVFHRADRVWTADTFDPMTNVYRGQRQPIASATMIAYSRRTGSVAYRLGENLFYMPHGLTVDAEGFLYATDVALHQVIKLRRDGDADTIAGDSGAGAGNRTTGRLSVVWTLGQPFRPGSGNDTFCKPTAVAVLPNGDFFVADGYCNSRIIKYSRDVRQLLVWGHNSFSGQALAKAPPYFFSVPHALTLCADRGWLCVADRENGRVQCFDTDGKFQRQYYSPLIGDRVFSVAYAPVRGGQLFVVNGPDLGPQQRHRVMGFVVDVDSGEVLAKFGPRGAATQAPGQVPVQVGGQGAFHDPHDVIVSPDGIEVYVADLANMAYKLVTADRELYNRSMAEFDRYRMNATNATTATSQTPANRQPSTMLLVASLIAAFVCLIGVLTLVMVRRRRLRDYIYCCCCCCGDQGRGIGISLTKSAAQRRRHAWDLPKAAESMRLGNFRPDGKGDFEPVNQEASDEECTTTPLTAGSGAAAGGANFGGISTQLIT